MKTRRNSGATLLELIVALGLLGLIVTGGYALLGTGMETYGQSTVLAEVERNAARALELTVKELAQAGRDVLNPQPAPPYASSSLSFQRCLGFKDGAVAWGATRIIEFRYLPDDPNDGRDNNGNGLIDEGMIVQVDNAGTLQETTTVLARGVREFLEGEVENNKDDNGNGLIDEPGLSFDVIGEVWTIRITIERLDAQKRIAMHTAQTSIKTRN